MLAGEESPIEYHVGIDFAVANERELVIIDEADALLYADPVKFRDFVNNCACVCFTATPDDQEPAGSDAKVLNAMTLKKFFYVLDARE